MSGSDREHDSVGDALRGALDGMEAPGDLRARVQSRAAARRRRLRMQVSGLMAGTVVVLALVAGLVHGRDDRPAQVGLAGSPGLESSAGPFSSGVDDRSPDPMFEPFPTESPSSAVTQPGGAAPASTWLFAVSPLDHSGHHHAGLEFRTDTDDAADPNGGNRCTPGSVMAGNALYRCVSRSGILDPCWSDLDDPAQPAAICAVGGPMSSSFVRVLLARPLDPNPAPSTDPAVDQPWAVMLSTGENCLRLGGGTAVVGGVRVSYACEKAGSDGPLHLLDGIDRSQPLWAMSSVTGQTDATYRVSGRVTVVVAWFGEPGTG
jgi:hypothetical protein